MRPSWLPYSTLPRSRTADPARAPRRQIRRRPAARARGWPRRVRRRAATGGMVQAAKPSSAPIRSSSATSPLRLWPKRKSAPTQTSRAASRSTSTRRTKSSADIAVSARLKRSSKALLHAGRGKAAQLFAHAGQARHRLGGKERPRQRLEAHHHRRCTPALARARAPASATPGARDAGHRTHRPRSRCRAAPGMGRRHPWKVSSSREYNGRRGRPMQRATASMRPRRSRSRKPPANSVPT